LTLYFASRRPGGYGENDLLVTTRETINDDWSIPVNLGSTVNNSAGDDGPYISADGLALFFHSNRPGGHGGYNLWVTTRQTVNDPWAPPDNLGPTLNGSGNATRPHMSADGLSLHFSSNSLGGFGHTDLYVSRRVTVEDEWGPPVNLGPTVNSTARDFSSWISADGLWLFFDSERPGGSGDRDLYVTTRATTDDEWGTPVNLGPTVNSAARDSGLNISPDGRTLYFHSDRPKADRVYNLWQAPIIPIVDLNGDGIVDAADMCIVVDNWGTDNKLCDVGPMPWGDGIVDVQDLIVLAEHFLPVFPAHWELDETEGSIAYDSVGDHDGTLNGNPLWQPAGGKIAGALEFDGIDDYVSTPFILDPAKGSLSTFAWIKGGAPGQVIISQTDGIGGTGETWLGADPSGGKLVSGLVPPPAGRFVPQPLESQSIITEGQWHHIGFVWDGSYRFLYVDGIEVAKDAAAQIPLKSSDGGLYIGADKTLDEGTFFSGLIDDVRIYNVALSAEKIAALAQ